MAQEQPASRAFLEQDFDEVRHVIDAKITPAEILAKQHRQKAKPGGGQPMKESAHDRDQSR